MHVNSKMAVGRPPREAHLPLPSGRGDRGGSPCRGGVENGGPWWPGGGLEVAGLWVEPLLLRHPCYCWFVLLLFAGAVGHGWGLRGGGSVIGEDGGARW